MASLWQGRRVLVTGHTGFKGGWMCLWLKALGAQVWGLALPPPTTPSLYETARVESEVDSMRVDINDFPSTLNAVAHSEPEVVFHLAAQSLVRRSYIQPLATFSTNVLGTAHVLEAVRQVGTTRAVVVVTSDKCYENREWPWGYRETESMGGHDPYSSSKGCTELVSAAYRRSFLDPGGVHIATARAGNVYGGGDWAADRLVPDLMRAFMERKTAIVRNPGAIRPWQHVLEPLHGYLLLAERLLTQGAGFADAWNFGPDIDAERTVAEVARMLTGLWGAEASWKHEWGAAAPHEANFLKLDSSKARQHLGWKPRWGLAEGLAYTAQWYRAYFEGRDVRELMESQIARYAGTAEAAPTHSAGEAVD